MDADRDPLWTSVQHVLTTWAPADRSQDDLRRGYLRWLEREGPAALRRDGGPEHLTASCYVVSADRRRVLLCSHRKGRFWVQLGGHLEPADRDLGAAALREGVEEGGIEGLRLVEGVLDLDRHELSGAFGRCRAHWDVAFLVVAPEGAVPVTSEESEDVAWFEVDALPVPLAGSVAERLTRLLTHG
ncbi:NUDIX domain-containing protein [Auraticoccus monumenti]|uniref:8-oxo-dGTP pyrophosphatase MutT, NUDIX family n=1 Tax=Auraticoccus monumenti TaxID=675864 RepID=A0A1G7DPG7_9ACTN|nr:NUDIX domain-containing protein [Auraticoccus monumenti]SDE53397.1 8-oxo-dGTP pyrophosphatase MutT, NUDIX family [Auraticoccus monumenti]